MLCALLLFLMQQMHTHFNLRSDGWSVFIKQSLHLTIRGSNACKLLFVTIQLVRKWTVQMYCRMVCKDGLFGLGNSMTNHKPNAVMVKGCFRQPLKQSGLHWRVATQELIAYSGYLPNFSPSIVLVRLLLFSAIQLNSQF